MAKLGTTAASLLLTMGLLTNISFAQQTSPREMPADEAIERPIMPNQADIDAAMKRARGKVEAGGGTEAIERATRKAFASPIGAGKGPSSLPATSRMPDISRLMKGGGVDPASLAEKYAAPDSPMIGEERIYRLVVFASLSMPLGSLQRLGRDVKKVGGVIVLRGMRYGVEPGTWAKSLEAMKPLVATGAEIQINPAMFQLFQIRAVPTLLVSPDGVADKGCAEGRCAAGTYATVVGDVTLDYALYSLSERSDAVGTLSRKLYDVLQ